MHYGLGPVQDWEAAWETETCDLVKQIFTWEGFNCAEWNWSLCESYCLVWCSLVVFVTVMCVNCICFLYTLSHITCLWTLQHSCLIGGCTLTEHSIGPTDLPPTFSSCQTVSLTSDTKTQGTASSRQIDLCQFC